MSPGALAPTGTSRAAVSVDELKRAWAAVEGGQFRRRPHATTQSTGAWPVSRAEIGRPGVDAHGWAPAPGERVLPILGCAGSAGTTTVALAVALSAGSPARVVECCSVTASGLAAASDAELGLHESGWRQGTRDGILVERASEVLIGVGQVPLPSIVHSPKATHHAMTLTVLDIGWELGQLFAIESWLSETIRTAPVVIAVAPATVPGLRRLEGALEMLADSRVIAALRGPRFKRWPKGLANSAGPNTRRLLEEQRYAELPGDRGLAVGGVGSAPLPAPLLRAAGRLLDHAQPRRLPHG